MADSTIITTQYVQIEQTPANVGVRLLARIIDLTILGVYVFILSYVLMRLYSKADILVISIYVILLLPAIFYSLLWEVFNNGQSPGKKIFGIRVVMKDGSAPRFSAYLLRWLLLLVDLHMQYIGLIMIAVTKNNQRLGDLVAGTLVIKEKDYHKIDVTLSEFNHLSSDYRPVFVQAENLSLEQINLITDTLHRNDAERLRRIHDLANKVRAFLNIEAKVEDEALLQTLTRDYQYYALEEI